ncbi:hypothetical protein [Streptomyces phaeofaciens]|uniref:hypothetical protein n=1 Tax=Streptomyces phaeofaciens TaxID=68254 RepID=UPI003686B44E
MKNALLGVVAAGLLLVGAGSAVADSWHGLGTLETTGADLLGGRYRFNPPERNHGSFEWRGDLRDMDHHDGHNVYMQVRVESHPWVRYKGKQRKTVTLHHSDWVGAQRYVNKAEIRVCRDRGSLRPDNCSDTKKYFATR